jgi:hypothetical protein
MPWTRYRKKIRTKFYHNWNVQNIVIIKLRGRGRRKKGRIIREEE